MNKFISHSQAGQDAWVWVMSKQSPTGTFVDIGCGHPIIINNTYGLEQMGWSGVLVDNSVEADTKRLNLLHRTGQFWNESAASIDWDKTAIKPVTDYLSLDANGGSLPSLKHLPLERLKFKLITIEHDKYRFGPAIQNAMREFLIFHGYDLICADVSKQGSPFEDWWVLPPLVDMELANRFRCQGQEYTDILAKA